MLKLVRPPRLIDRTSMGAWKGPVDFKLPLSAIRLSHGIQNQAGGKRQGAEKHQRDSENRGRETRHETGRNKLANDGNAQNQSRREKR